MPAEPTPRVLCDQDRTYVPQHNKTKVYDLGLQIFRDSVARHPDVRQLIQLLDARRPTD